MELSDRQREIIDAALSLINDQGIQELTMKRIAAVVGVSEPAIYRHFSSKSDIMAAIVDEMNRSRTKALNAAKTIGFDSVKTLTTFFEIHAAEFIKRPSMTLLLFSDDLFRHDDILLSRIAGIIAATQDVIKGEIEKGKSEGLFLNDIDAGSFSLMILGGFRLLVSRWRQEDYSFDLSAHTQKYMKFALKLIQNRV